MKKKLITQSDYGTKNQKKRNTHKEDTTAKNDSENQSSFSPFTPAFFSRIRPCSSIFGPFLLQNGEKRRGELGQNHIIFERTFADQGWKNVIQTVKEK